MAEVRLQAVVKEYGGSRAVDGVSLTIGDGEFFTLLGPSGCGKTTTLRLVAGLEYADKGRILIGGREVTRVPPSRRGIAMVFQNYALYPHMTIFGNIAYPLKLRQVPEGRREEIVREIAGRLGIGGVLSRLPGEISGGQQQRAALARAMVQEPQVYLFDEPLSNLDARLRLESRRFLRQVLKETGGTAVYVTHDQAEAMALSDRVGVMKEGRLKQVAPPTELYAKPASVFVAGFVGHLPMNLVEGEVVPEGGLWFVSGEFRLPLPRGTATRPGTKITLGIRPEEILVSPDGDLAGAVENVEPLGSEKIVTINVSGHSLICRLVHDPVPSSGEILRLSLPSDRLHFFDEDGERIPPPPGTA